MNYSDPATIALTKATDPEYVQLCRMAALVREPQPGDPYVTMWGGFDHWEARVVSMTQIASGFFLPFPEIREASGSFWMPRLNQVLDLLADPKAVGSNGHDVILFNRGHASGGWYAEDLTWHYHLEPGPQHRPHPLFVGHADRHMAYGQSREEAALRLFLAVRTIRA